MSYNEYMLESVGSILVHMLREDTLTNNQTDTIYNLACEKYMNEASSKVNAVVKKYSCIGFGDDIKVSTKGGSNSKYGQAIRKVDILNNQLKRGKITQEEFDKEYEKLKEKVGILPKKGSNVFFSGHRPNKDKPTMKPEDFMHYGKEHKSRRHDDMDDTMKEKLKRHLDICNTTDDYNEYQNHRRAICNIVGLPKDSTLQSINLQKNKIFLTGHSKSKDKPVTDAKKLMHSSKVDDLKALKPTFRSDETQPVLYADKRTYFYKDKETGGRMGSSGSKDENKYIYTGKRMKDARVDPELRGDAVYVSSNDKFKVKKLDKQKE